MIKHKMEIFIYLYLIVPIVIFLACWTRWYIAIPVIITIIYSFILLIKSDIKLWKFEWSRSDKEKFLFCVGIIMLWVYLSGIGAFVYQNNDHTARNAIFNALVEKSWPVTTQLEMDGVATERGLVYYIGFWLPAAVVGKLFGLRAGYNAQALWAVIGLVIFYYLICCIRKKISVWPLLVFVFFSGLDVVGYFITQTDTSSWNNALHIEWWADNFQYSSFTTQLFWVFNQALPVWIITALMFLQKNNQHIVFLLALTMMSSTLPFIGLIPFVLYFMLSREYENDGTRKPGIIKFTNKLWWRSFVKDTFTFPNICGGGAIGILSFLYLKGNSAGKLIGETVQDGNPKGYLLLYILFVLLEVGVYFIAIQRYYRDNRLFYISLLWLCICPLITIGTGYDFCMRASIPALVILYIFVVNSIDCAVESKEYINLAVIVVIILIGAVTAKNEIVRTISTTVYRYENNIEIIDEPSLFENIMKSKNFSGDANEGIWGKYISK